MAKLQISLKARALRYLSAREHSRQELGRKLARYAQEGDDVEALLDTLEAAKFLSQSRFSESLVTGDPHNDTLRFAGKLHAELKFATINDVLHEGLHDYLTEFLEDIYAVSYTHLTLPTTPYV